MKRSMRPLVSIALASIAIAAGFPQGSPVNGAAKASVLVDQGLNASEEPAFRKALKLLKTDPNVDSIITVRQSAKPLQGCRKTGTVYWVYAARGTICFTRKPKGAGWRFSVQVVKGKNPLRKQDPTALSTLEEERKASTFVEDPTPRNIIASNKVTYPYAYERIAAEFDGDRAGDFVILQRNNSDSGNKGGHAHLGVSQSRSTFLIAGRGARRSPLSAKAERRLRMKHPDIAPTVARALGVNPYFQDTNEPATLLNGKPSQTALLERQDGRVLNQLLEPVYNTFVVSIDGLRPENVSPTLMPNLTSMLDEECVPGGVCATSYEQARAIMVTETNGNHNAMMTGSYGETSGLLSNESFDRAAGEEIDLDQPALNLAETLFDRIERKAPWLRTALVMGKNKLTSLFDCTRTDDGECGPSSANPEGIPVNHVLPDFVGGATSAPSDPDIDCPAEPGTGSGYATNTCTMDAALALLGRSDPDFTFINLSEVDGMSHLFGADSPQAQAAVAGADLQLGRLVDALRASGRWQRSTVIVTADHNFGDTVSADSRIFLDSALGDAGPSPFKVVTHGGSASVFLTDMTDPDRALTTDEQETLKAIRAAALGTDGVAEALYRRPNPLDGGDENTLDRVHPAWKLGGTGRIGELLITADEQRVLVPDMQSSDGAVLGHHGHPTDRGIPFYVLSGGTYVKDQSVSPSDPDRVNEGDDTSELPEQAEQVDIAPTIGWLLGVGAPADAEGRVLKEAFTKHPSVAERQGEITEPIAKRAAIFMFDQNNSVLMRCLIDPRTCGDPIPEEAQDPGLIPNLSALAAAGTLLRYGSISAWPSVTMPNHNTVGSGAYPGHHGLVNNRFYLRQEKTLEAPIDPQDPRNPLYVGTSRYLVDEIETLHEAVHRTYGDWTPADGPDSDKAYTASVDEPSARGADYATLEPADSFPNPADYIATQNPSELAQDTTQACADENPDGYGLESTLDHQGQTQARRLFDDEAQHPLPRYLINNFTLTDGSGHHFGSHTPCNIAAYRDSDRRLGRILDAMGGAGVLGETLIVITGDHGAENQDLEASGGPGDFSTKLTDAGIAHVMADWHVYLLTTAVSADPSSFQRGQEIETTFTVTDDDTTEPVEGATVKVTGIAEGTVEGTTDAEGKVTLTFTPSRPRLRVLVTAEGFSDTRIRYKPRR